MNPRYEEYRSPPEQPPFVFHRALRRTPTFCSHEANWHDNLEIQFCCDGEGTVLLDGRVIPFTRGDIVAVNSNVIHYTGTQTALTYHCLILDPEFCCQAGIDPAVLLFEEHFRSEELTRILSRIAAVFADSSDVCRSAKLKMLTLALLIELREHHTIFFHETPKKQELYPQIRQAIRYIRKNYSQKLTVDDIARHTYMNKYVLSRQFRKVTKQSIMEYINGLRCHQARILLADGALAVEAAMQCGFTNLSYFTRTFKKYTGQLPSECRKAGRQCHTADK